MTNDLLEILTAWAWRHHTALAAIALFFAWALWQTQLYPRYFSKMRSLPGPPFGHYLFGQMGPILAWEAGLLQLEWAKKYADERHVIRAVGPFGIERVFFLSPKAAQQILVDDVFDFPRAQFVRSILGTAVGFGLLTVEGHEHRSMRRMMQPAFSLAHLSQLVPMFYSSIEICKEIFDEEIAKQSGKDHCVLDVYEAMSHCTLDIICETAFGYHCGCQRNPKDPLAKHYGDLIGLQTGPNLAKMIVLVSMPGGFYLRGLLKRFAPKTISGPIGEFDVAINGIKKIAREMLRSKTKSKTGEEAESGKDVLSLLVKANQSEDGSSFLTEDQMMDQVLTFLGAGHETTASGMTWTLYLLSKNPKVQERLRKECADLLGRKQEPTMEDLNSLKYLEAVVKESLRVMPPVPATMRTTRVDKARAFGIFLLDQAQSGQVVDGVFVPAHTFVYIAIRSMNMLPELWGEDSEKFRPERWLNIKDGETPAGSRYAFNSFIHGAHSCIGGPMSLIEMKAMLAVFCANYSFEFPEGQEEPVPKAAITMKPRDGLPLRIRKVKTFANALT